MATRRRSILGGLHPKGSVYPDAFSNHGGGTTFDPLVWVFADTGAREELHGVFQVPEDFASAAQIKVYWTASATSGNVEWDFDYDAAGGDDAETLDPSSADESVNVADAAPTTAANLLVVTLSLTDGNFAAGDTVQFILARDGADAGDTMSAAAILVEAAFEYST